MNKNNTPEILDIDNEGLGQFCYHSFKRDISAHTSDATLEELQKEYEEENLKDFNCIIPCLIEEMEAFREELKQEQAA